jgi:AGCS family alanine or glycine:cation symporter
MSLSSVVGMGCIAGVAMAVCIGGPGAIFWLVLFSFLSMNTSFAETILAVHYSSVNLEQKTVDCAPVRYIRESLRENGLLWLGTVLSAVYGVMYFLGLLGNQVYQINEAVSYFTNFAVLARWRVFLVMFFAILVTLVVYMGIARLAKIFERILPVVSCSYLLLVVITLVYRWKYLPQVIALILREAFRLRSATGGIVAAISTGIRRGSFCSEAGLGSATTPYAAAASANPVAQASLGSLNPLLVSLVCLASGLLVVSGMVTMPNLLTKCHSGTILLNEVLGGITPVFSIIFGCIIPVISLNLCSNYSINAHNVFTNCFGSKSMFICTLVQLMATAGSLYFSLPSILMVSDTLYLSLAIPNILCLVLVQRHLRRIYQKNLVALGL